MTELTKDERSLLLYFETCLVDNSGNVDVRRMNDNDRAIAERWTEQALIRFERRRYHDIPEDSFRTHHVQFSAYAWILAHQERRARAERHTETFRPSDMVIPDRPCDRCGKPLDNLQGEYVMNNGYGESVTICHRCHPSMLAGGFSVVAIAK